MSTRTIIEVNHDYIADLLDKGDISEALYREIMDYYHRPALKGERQRIWGVKVLGTRHHSETLVLEIK